MQGKTAHGASSDRLRNGIEQCRLSAIDDRKSAANGRSQVLWIGDRAFCVPSQTLCDFCQVDGRIVDRRADPAPSDIAMVLAGHALDLHHLSVVRPVVVHDGQHGNPVMGGRPQDARLIHQVTIALEIKGYATMLAVCERRAYRRRSAVTDANRSGLPDVLIILLEIPKLLRPATHSVATGYQGPIFVFDLRPQFGSDAGRAERASIPPIGRPQTILVFRALMRRGQLGPAGL